MTSFQTFSDPTLSTSFATLNQKIKTLSSSINNSNLTGVANSGSSGTVGSGLITPSPGISSGPPLGISNLSIPSGSHLNSQLNPQSPNLFNPQSNSQYQTPSRSIGPQSPLKASSQHLNTLQIGGFGSSFENINLYDMQHALNEWRNIQEIVRHSFVVLVEQIKHQQTEIKQQQSEIRSLHHHIKKQDEILEEHSNLLKSKATRSEVTLEVNKHLKDIEQSVEGKASMVDVVSLLEQKMNKDEVQKLLSTKANISELKQLSTEKANQNEINEFLDIHTKDILEIKNALTKKANTIEVVKELQKKASITDVQQALETKANVNDVQEALKHKANKQSVISALSKKISASDLEATLTQQKSDLHNDFSQQIASKADSDQISVLQNELTNLQSTAQNLKNQLEQKVSTSNLQSLLTQKANRDELISQIDTQTSRLTASFKSNIDESVQRIQTDLDIIQKKIDTKADESNLKRVVQLIKEIRTQVEQKANLEHVREALQTKASQNHFNQLKEEITNFVNRTEFEDKLNETKNSTINELNDHINEKLTDKVSISDLESLKKDLGTRATKEAVGAALKKKLNINDLNSLIEQYTDIENIKKDIVLKANIKDVMDLLGEKADSSEIELFKQVQVQNRELLDQKVNVDQYSQALQDQALINEALLSQNNMGRWIWKNGKLKSGYGVPWNVQVINTSPENYLWEKDRVNIITVQPGLYEIAFGFYGKKTPTIQLHVNGEPILSTGVEGTGNVVYNQASKKLRQKAGAITGLTHIDFLALPEKARIAISYAGEQKGEGFLSLRKL